MSLVRGGMLYEMLIKVGCGFRSHESVARGRMLYEVLIVGCGFRSHESVARG